MRHWLVFLVFALSTWTGAGAGIEDRIVELAEDRERRTVGLGRVRLSSAQGLSGAVGAMVVRQPREYDCTSVCEFRGLLLEAEPGISGAQLSAGFAVVLGEKGDNDFFLSNVFLGYGIKAALLRTWDGSGLGPERQSLIGLEGAFTVIRVNFSLGVFRPLDVSNAEDPWVVTGGIGWGF